MSSFAFRQIVRAMHVGLSAQQGDPATITYFASPILVSIGAGVRPRR